MGCGVQRPSQKGLDGRSPLTTAVCPTEDFCLSKSVTSSDLMTRPVTSPRDCLPGRFEHGRGGMASGLLGSPSPLSRVRVHF